MQVHYAEGKGEAARAALHVFLGGLPGHAGFLGAELLLSADQPELTLVASRWADTSPPLPVPDGVRAWVFQVQASR
ncbi:antibiotic biosynthesis monooxygenase [Deinococcus sp.]|uniref:antibiotic biosynthesis monooxygenase n=1 Tax=Deinococcus sp. TaxID=47478 RepID=UPI0025B8870C|nr:antibiotic biosynthesis monooxygenase [Deinococcus sp.]